MNWAKKIFFYTLLGLLPFMHMSGHAQNENRHFDDEALESYRQNSDFDYTTEYAKAGNLFRDFFIWLFALLTDLFSSSNPNMGKNIFQLLVLLVFIGGLLLMIRIKYGGVITSEGKTNLPMPVHFSTHQETDYRALLQESLEENDFHLSARYLYLLCIDNLNRQGKLKLSIWKTAVDYLHEIPAEERDAFGSVTRLFESCWYGDYSPEQKEFDHVWSLAKSSNIA
jgi:hypothetical protein